MSSEPGLCSIYTQDEEYPRDTETHSHSLSIMPYFSITFPPNKSSFLCVFICFFCFSHARDHKSVSSHFIDVHVNSLLPQEDLICTHSSRGRKQQGISLEVVHRHGPCSKIKSAAVPTPSHSDLLQLDQDRVDSIQARVSGESLAGEKVARKRKSANLPARSGASIGTGNYIVSVGLGTPRKDLSLVFDTGSDLTWTQCKPCVKSCYDQVDPIFDPSASSSYANISCASSVCGKLVSATGQKKSCSSSTCVYEYEYGDNSSSVGYFAKERISLGSAGYIDGYLFGCGENNQGLFGSAAGMLGLGRNQLSLVSQAADKYGKYFSYCLPSDSSSTGHLTLGHGGTKATSFSYTPLVPSSGGGRAESWYFIILRSISVAGRRLSISPAVFSTSGTFIDSGTVISRLPPKAYSVLRSAFKQYMSKYPSAPAISILDTCYDFSKLQTVSVPKVVLYFGGGGVLDLPVNNIVYGVSKSQVCLAFAGNSRGSDAGILGNVQHRGFDVVFDVDGGRIGFGPDGC